MQKNVPKYTPGLRPHGHDVGGGVAPGRVSTRSATTAGPCSGSPTSGPSSTTPRCSSPNRGPPVPTWCSTSTRRRGPTRSGTRSTRASWSARRSTELGLAGAVKTSGAKGVHVFVPVTDTEPDDRRVPRHPGDRRARRPARSRARHHGVRQGRPRRQGLPRLHPRARRHGDRRVQPAAAARCARSRSRWPGRRGRRRAAATSPSATPPGSSATATRGPTALPAPQQLPADLVAEGHEIPVARVHGHARGKAAQAGGGEGRGGREGVRRGLVRAGGRPSSDRSADSPARSRAAPRSRRRAAPSPRPGAGTAAP